MSAPDAPPLDSRQTVIEKLATLATLKQTLKEALAKYDREIAEIQQACTIATAEDVAAIAALEKELKGMAADDPESCFGKASRSVTQSLLILGVKSTSKVGFDGKEEDVLRELLHAARNHPNPKVRTVAAFCLRIGYEIHRDNILSFWDEFGPELTELGFYIIESDSAYLNAVKPAKVKVEKVQKEKGKKAVKNGETQEAAGV